MDVIISTTVADARRAKTPLDAASAATCAAVLDLCAQRLKQHNEHGNGFTAFVACHVLFVSLGKSFNLVPLGAHAHVQSEVFST